MGRVCLCALVFFCTGCAALTERNYYTESFCYGKFKYDRKAHRAYAGVSCRF